MTTINPRGADLMRALQHSLYIEETRTMHSLTFTPPSFSSPVIGGGGPQDRRGRASHEVHEVPTSGFHGSRLRPSPSAPYRGHLPPMTGEAEELFDLHGWPTAAGRAWLASQPRALPEPEAPARTRQRMAAEIARAVSASGCVTERDLERAGFTRAEIDTHFRAALRQAGAIEMAG